MKRTDRRRFLEDTLLAAAAAATAGPAIVAAGEPQSKSPNERLGIAVIGVRGRGWDHVQAFSQRSDCKVLAVCDPDREVAGQRAEKAGCRAVADLRELFDDKSIDAVSIATPNHWHALAAIWAMQAGKDVYVEKPACHNIREGRRAVQVARKHGRVCQVGTQRRSNLGLAAAARYLTAGKMGKITLARSVMNRRRESIGPKVEGKVPPGLDYNLWAGPAPMAPITRKTFHYDWHWFWDFGNGEIGNNDIHMIDLVVWGLGLRQLPNAVMCYGGRLGFNDAAETANTQVVVHDFGETTVVQEVRNLDTKSGFGPSGGMFNSSEGYMVFADSGAVQFDPQGKKVRTFTGPVEDHFANFVKAVRSRKIEDCPADIFGGHLGAGLCHLGNISYRLGCPAAPSAFPRQFEARKVHDNVQNTFERTQKHLAANGIDLEKTSLTLGPWLAFDPVKEAFIDWPDADALLTRPYRAPFILPKESEI
jgi:predicted dehydrogenase